MKLPVTQGGAGGVTTLLKLSDDTETGQIGEPEKITAAAAFLGCVSALAKNDKRFLIEASHFRMNIHSLEGQTLSRENLASEIMNSCFPPCNVSCV